MSDLTLPPRELASVGHVLGGAAASRETSAIVCENVHRWPIFDLVLTLSVGIVGRSMENVRPAPDYSTGRRWVIAQPARVLGVVVGTADMAKAPHRR